MLTGFSFQIISSIDSAPDILNQVQEVVVPVIVFTLENRMLGMSATALFVFEC